MAELATVVAEPLVFAPQGWPLLPERSIVLDVALWCRRYLRQPDGPDAGQPWTFTDEQLRILTYWFAFDEVLRWVYRRGTVRMCKGWGKDPFAAVLAAVELCGPCRVGPDGHGVEHPAPLVQIAAVSRDQTQTTMRLFPGLFSEEAKARYAIDINKTVVYARGGRAVIEAVTSSPDSAEGPRTTLAIRNEIQNWKSNNAGHEMAEVIDGNLAKSRDGAGRAISFCNAHVPGEDSVGEREWDAWQAIVAGLTRARDVFYYAVEAPPDTKLDDEGSLRTGLRLVRGDAHWIDEDRQVAEVWDPRTAPSESRRKKLNQIIAAEDAWAAPHEWNACRVDATLAEGEEVTLGFDGGKTDDHCALIATRISDGCEFTLGVWDPARFGGEAPRFEIDGAVLAAKDRYDVVGFYSDLEGWESYVDKWRDDFGDELIVNATPHHSIAWDMRSRTMQFTRAAERFQDAMIEGRLLHDGDGRLAQHVYNARRRPNRWGVSFGKEHRESARKVDALAAAVLSRLAWWDFMALPESKRRRRKRTGKAMFGG